MLTILTGTLFFLIAAVLTVTVQLGGGEIFFWIILATLLTGAVFFIGGIWEESKPKKGDSSK